MKRSLYVIDEACSENWDAMRRKGANARFCERCQHDVIDTTRMSERDVSALYDASGGELCVQAWTNQEGEIHFRKTRGRGIAGALVAAALSIGCGVTPSPIAPSTQVEAKETSKEAPAPQGDVAENDEPAIADDQPDDARENGDCDRDCEVPDAGPPRVRTRGRIRRVPRDQEIQSSATGNRNDPLYGIL